jgi:hypothetical protein
MPVTYTDYLNNPAQTYTLEEFINMKNTDGMTYNNFSIYEKIDGQNILELNVLDEYLDELVSICKVVKLTRKERNKYKYAPDLLAYDVYGSVQLDFVILAVNDMIDPKDFNLKKLKLPTASNLSAFLNEVYTCNSSWISKNRYDLKNNK